MKTETKDVEEWESYSEDEVQHAPVSKVWRAPSTKTSNNKKSDKVQAAASDKPAAIAKKTKKAGKPEGQKSLFSFFGKK